MDVRTESEGPFCSLAPLVVDLTGKGTRAQQKALLKKPRLKSSQPHQPCQRRHN